MTVAGCPMTRALCCLVALLAVAACGTTAPSRFYTLSSVPPERGLAGPPSKSGSDQRMSTLLVGTIEMPQTLDRPQFVRRSGSNTIELAELDRWSEPLDGMIRRSLADDLAARLPQARILTSVLPSVPIDHTLMLEVDRFEADATGTVKLNAQWFVLTEGVSAPPLSRRSTIEEHAASNSTEAIVVAMSRALAALSNEIAAALPGLPPRLAKMTLPITRTDIYHRTLPRVTLGPAN
jgi:uncharacterized protein